MPPAQETSPAFEYRQVVEPYEDELDIAIYGLGVCLSLAFCYSHSLAIDFDDSWVTRCFKISYR